MFLAAIGVGSFFIYRCYNKKKNPIQVDTDKYKIKPEGNDQSSTTIINIQNAPATPTEDNTTNVPTAPPPECQTPVKK